jgi:hypothetical protein
LSLRRPKRNMAGVDREASIRFLNTAFEPIDCVAVLLKSYERSGALQRVGPVSCIAAERFQRWLRAMNARKYNVFVSVNVIALGRRSRTRAAISAIRHVFLDADLDGAGVLSRVTARADLPQPNYVLHSSPNHAHIFWRVAGFDNNAVERLQKQLAHELGTDLAATPATQTTRLPGFFNHKRAEPHLVTIEYRDVSVRYSPSDFPAIDAPSPWTRSSPPNVPHLDRPVLERVKRYLASVPPAIAGQHGDVHTFRVCCRLVRGFALSERQALDVLSEWNAGCIPPWSSDELLNKIRRAERYGREPVGGLL